MARKVGKACKLYRNSGSYAVPVWNEIKLVKDATVTLEGGEADASSRGGGGWEEMLQGLKSLSIEAELQYDAADAEFIALKNAFVNDTQVEFAAVDGDIPTTAAEGIRATCRVFGFTRNEGLGDAVTTSLVLKPTPNADAAPAWVSL